MPFADVKAELLLRASKLESCSQYLDVLDSTTYEELLEAACGLFAWAYQTNIMSDDLVPEIDEATWNTYGVYTTGSVSLIDPLEEDYTSPCTGVFLQLEESTDTLELYFILASDLTLSLSGSSRLILYLMGDATATISLGGGSGLDLKMFNNATANIVMNGQSLLCAQVNDVAQLILDTIDSPVANISTRGHSSILMHLGGTSVTKIQSWAKSTIDYTMLGTPIIDIQSYNKSVVTNITP